MKTIEEFQSPYGGRGRSDRKRMPHGDVLSRGFNHLTVAGVGQTGNIAYLCNWKGQRFNHLTVAGVGQTL